MMPMLGFFKPEVTTVGQESGAGEGLHFYASLLTGLDRSGHVRVTLT